MSKLSEARRRIEVMGMAEAQEELKKQRRQLFDLRMQLARGEVKNNRQFPQIRADIARLMYHISELNREARRELARAQQSGGAPAAEAEPEQPAVSAAAEPAARPARRTRATAPKSGAASEAPEPADSEPAATKPATRAPAASKASKASADKAAAADEASATETTATADTDDAEASEETDEQRPEAK